MKRLRSDLLPVLVAAADGRLEGQTLEWRDDAALCVVMAARGYPGDSRKGTEIGGLAAAGTVEGVTIFHAATAEGGDGRILANGGRVLGVTAFGATVREAQGRAYQAVDRLDWADGFCRRDIGWRAIARGA
jgi:phosphoribosylamine--glycine ligase